jgi:hypothetical protein
LHYEFSGFNGNGTENVNGELVIGKNEVNVTTAIQEQQNLNMENPALKEDSNGQTYCNRATMNVIKTAESAIGPVGIFKDANISLPMANANSCADALASGKLNYKSVNKETATSEAKNGNLVVLAYKNPSGSGHLATLSVGENISKGFVANVGPKAYTGFVELNAAYSGDKQSSIIYYVIKNK